MTHPTWDVTSGAADAISIKVDVSGVILHGIGVYCADHDQQYFYTCEVCLIILSLFLIQSQFAVKKDGCRNIILGFTS